MFNTKFDPSPGSEEGLVCFLQVAISIDLLPDDLQTVLPELARADVDAEAGGQVGGGPFAGGGQQGLVIGHEVLI